MVPIATQLEPGSVRFFPLSFEYELTRPLPYVAMVLIVWEYCITVDDEIKFFWFSKLSWIKCLLFVNRYIQLVLQIWNVVVSYLQFSGAMDETRGPFLSETLAAQACGFLLFPTGTVYVLLQILIMHSILILRVWAMSGRRRCVLYVFLVYLLLSMGASAYLLAEPRYSFGFTFWIPMIVFEFLPFLTAAIYGLRGVKISRILAQVRHNFGPKPIMRLLLRDSVFYFLVVACSYPFVFLEDNEMGLALMSITITRMLLRLRNRAEADLNMPRTQDIELATVLFAIPATDASMASDTYA